MNDFCILIADPDREFVETLVDSAARLFVGNVQLRAVTRPEILAEALSSGSTPHILLVAEEWLSMPIAVPEGCLVVGIGEGRTEEKCGQAGQPVPVVSKYQSLYRLFGDLSALYQQRFPDRVPNRRRSTSILSFYSTQGGAGKSTAAFLLAKRLASKGRRVLLLSLEWVSWLSLHATDTLKKDAFSQALYCIKTDPDALAGEWEKLCSTDAETGFDFLMPVSEMAEWADTTESEITKLIKVLLGMSFYDWILLDLDSCPSPRVRAAFAAGGPIWWLLTEDEACLYKTSMLLNQKRNDVFPDVLRSHAAVRFVLNKARRPTAETFERYGIPIVASLPWVETCALDRNDRETDRLADALYEVFLILEGEPTWKKTNDFAD